MSKFIQLSVLTGLLGLASTLVACGGDEMTAEEAAKASSGDLCKQIASNAGESSPSEDDLKACETGLEMLKEMSGDGWPKVAECLAKAKSESDMEKCGEKAGEAMTEELEKED